MTDSSLWSGRAIACFVLLAVASAAALPAAEDPAAGRSACPACDVALSVLSARAATQTVTQTEYVFTQMSVTIAVGDTVTWTNNGATAHTSTSDTGVWDSGTMNPGASFSRTFTTPGTFPYHCSFHQALGMTGTVTVTGSPPVITSSATASATVNSPFSYAIAASDGPTSFGASGLPGGLAVDPVTGVVSGIPSSAGSFPITLSASNSSGTGTASLALTVVPQPAGSPVISSSGGATGTVGAAFSFAVTATNSPTSFTATGLPAGLSLSSTTGAITGTPTAAGTTHAIVTATNASGSGSARLDVVIAPAPGGGGGGGGSYGSSSGGSCGAGAGAAALALGLLMALRLERPRRRRW
jgi:plastocyanin